MERRALHLRTPRSLADVGAEAAHRLWRALAETPDFPRMDAHAFPDFEKTVARILMAHVDSCETDNAAKWDAWSQTGGPAGHIRGPVCGEHAQRLSAEVKKPLAALERDLSSTVFHWAQAVLSLAAFMERPLAAAIEKAAMPVLIDNLGGACCDECPAAPEARPSSGGAPGGLRKEAAL